PAGAVDARRDTAALVRDRADLLVERHLGQREAAVADAAEDEAARNRLSLAGRLGSQRASLVGDQPVAHDLDSLDALVAEDRDRRDEEAQADLARLVGRLALRELAQDGEVARRVRVALGRGDAFELGRLDDA